MKRKQKVKHFISSPPVYQLFSRGSRRTCSATFHLLPLHGGADSGPRLPVSGLGGGQRPRQLDFLFLQLSRILPNPPRLVLPTLGPRHPRPPALPPPRAPERLQTPGSGPDDGWGGRRRALVGWRHCRRAPHQRLQLRSERRGAGEPDVVGLPVGQLRGELRNDKAAKRLGVSFLAGQRGRRAKRRRLVQNGDVEHREGPDRWGSRAAFTLTSSPACVSVCPGGKSKHNKQKRFIYIRKLNICIYISQ